MELLQGEIINCQQILNDSSSNNSEYVKKIIRITTRQKQKIKVKNFANLLELCKPGCKSTEFSTKLQNLCEACGGRANLNFTSTSDPQDDKDCPEGTVLTYRGPTINFSIRQPPENDGEQSGGAGDGDNETTSRGIRRRFARMASYFPAQNFFSFNLLFILFLLILFIALYSVIVHSNYSGRSAYDEFSTTSSTTPIPEQPKPLFRIKPDNDAFPAQEMDPRTLETETLRKPSLSSSSQPKTDAHRGNMPTKHGRNIHVDSQQVAGSTAGDRSSGENASSTGNLAEATIHSDPQSATASNQLNAESDKTPVSRRIGRDPCGKCGSAKCGKRRY